MKDISGHNPFKTIPPIFFDKGASTLVGEKLKALGCKKTLLIYDKGIESTGISAKIAGYIKDAGITLIENNTVQADPPDVSVNEIAEIARKENVDSVVALGGGSAIDTGKCVNLLLTNEGDIRKYFDRSLPQKAGKVLIAIPTTAGTGSESTAGAVITDTAKGTKGIVGGLGTFVNMSLTDPLLTVGIPPYISAATGFDALAHALDGFVSIRGNDFTKFQAEFGIKLFRDSINEVVTNGKNIEARSKMFAAATIGGLIIGGASCSLIHAYGHSLGAVYHVAHGNCCTIFMPAVLIAVADIIPDDIRTIAKSFDIPFADGDASRDIAKKIGITIMKLAKKNGLKMITDIESNKEELYKLIPIAQADVMSTTSPLPHTEELGKEIIDLTLEIVKEI